MALIIPPGYADIACEMRCDGDPDPWYVTWGQDISGAEGDPVTIGAAASNAWQQMMTLISPSVTFTGVKITVGQDGPEPVRYFFANETTIVGGSSTQKLPQNCAVLVKKTSQIGGRRARGRFFVPNLAVEGEVDAVGNISPSGRNQMQSAANATLNALINDAIPQPMVILHSTGISSTIDPTPVFSLLVDGVISTQRRRLR